MGRILGIDTGGTYTDGVIIDYDSKETIKSAKAFTTKDDLTVGISNCIDKLRIEDMNSICLVCLSTTLATNAVVEGKAMPTGLITIGASFVDKKYPASMALNVEGKQDIMGRETMPLNKEEISAALLSMRGKVKALAISGYASVRNPQQELEVCTLAKEILDVPVVCGYELTSALGFYERTVTAVLNARLIPIITELIDKTRQVLENCQINAPIIIVKGDGHLMVDSFAREHPVETVLSGPAASMIGGRFLTGLDDAIIVDMGGTTTDIVFVSGGQVAVEEEGASVGDWKTRVKAVHVKSFGLGGDSYMRLTSDGELVFGPNRVVPLCVAADEYPYLKNEIKTLSKGKNYTLINRMETDCLKLFKKRDLSGIDLGKHGAKLLELLGSGPHSLLYMADMLGTDIDSLGVERLLDMELVQLISMTPTDILHASGEYEEWDGEASAVGARLYGDIVGKSPADFLACAQDTFVYRICYCIMQSILEADGINIEKSNKKNMEFIINGLLGRGKGNNLRYAGDLVKPVVGIGAPSGAWIAKAAKILGARFVSPDHDAVANAIGAAVSDIKESVEAMIYYDPHISRYVAFLPERRKTFQTLEEAKVYCRHQVKDCAEILAQRLAIVNPDILLNEQDEYIENRNMKNKSFIKTTIRAKVSGEALTADSNRQ